jgi:hypothetical protein
MQANELRKVTKECISDTGVGQNSGNITDTVHISLLIWCWTPNALNIAAVLLGLGLYKL